LPEDRAAFLATQEQRPVVRGDGTSPLSVELRRLGERVHGELAGIRPCGFGRALHRDLDGR
ncbi:MAG: hypothetical protein KDB61_11160, partial [Planctomycetes bacterium]|nr:hypothetical protein [Planctomycetota bacterium]